MSSSIFAQEISKQNQPTLFGAFQTKTENEEQKTNISSSLFNNDKPNLFGSMFNPNGNNEQKSNQESKVQNTLFGSNPKKNLFESSNKNDDNEGSNNPINSNQGGLFKFDLLGSANKKGKNEGDSNLFKSPGDKKEISKNLFQNDNKGINLGIKKETQIKNENEIKKKEVETISKPNNNSITFGKKEENKITTKTNLFGKPESKNPGIDPIPKNEKNNFISPKISNKNTISTNQTSNKLTSTKRIEDDDQVQKALQNLYVSDILLPSPFSYSMSYVLKKEKNEKNKINIKKKSKTIDFQFFVEIKDMPNKNYEGCNMICKSDESMSKLMKQAHLFMKKKYKMTKELNDFDISLMKNGYELPINDDEFIGDYVKNNDKIIIYLVHKSSEQKEEKQLYRSDNININKEENKEIKKVRDNVQEEEEEEEDEIINNNIIEEKEKLSLSQNIKNNNQKKELVKDPEEEILCPTNKLPILKREGYFMNPDEYTISRMTLKEIKNVENFSLFNENGKIEFEGKVSLYGANLDKLFNIEHEFIEYEKGEWCHSPRGQNFNVPAVITFYNVQSNIDTSNDNEKKMFIEMIKIKCQKYLNAKFISYDFDEGTLIYKIPYFY